MKAIFKEAHKMTREMAKEYEVDYQAQFGLCLSFLFEENQKEEKEVKKAELKGSEKQIKWAEDIREEQLESFYRFQSRWLEKRKTEGNQEEIDYIEELTRKILSIEEAEKWIEINQRQVTLHKLLVPKNREYEMGFLEGIF